MRWFGPRRHSEQDDREGRSASKDKGKRQAHDAVHAERLQRQLNLHATWHTLPALLDCSRLPNGIVELVIEDSDAATRQLFDIHDGHITLVEPGKCVPWASIAGSPEDWTAALGPERTISVLALTGDEQLAKRVLDALPPAT
jgi:hypothetical protein